MSYNKDKIIALIYRIFRAEEFEWYNYDGSYGTPSYTEIEDTIKDLEKDAYKYGRAETGRIIVEYNKSIKSFNYYFNLE